jgi:hypothetical protein
MQLRWGRDQKRIYLYVKLPYNLDIQDLQNVSDIYRSGPCLVPTATFTRVTIEAPDTPSEYGVQTHVSMGQVTPQRNAFHTCGVQGLPSPMAPS